MKFIKIELNKDEQKIFEFKFYQYQGIQIAVNQFLETNKFQYEKEHSKRLIDTYTEKMKSLNDYILMLLENNGYSSISLKIYNYEYTKGVLKVFF